jgi:hypothetical protein
MKPALKVLARLHRLGLNIVETVLREQRLRGPRTLAAYVLTAWAVDLFTYAHGYTTLLVLAFYVQAAGLGALLLLNLVHSTLEKRLFGRQTGWLRSRKESETNALAMLRHLPEKLREMIERGEESLPEQIRFVRAVVGFVRLDTENVKNRRQAFDVATQTATENGFIVLRETSEGLIFLANYFENANWPLSLVKFYESLLVRIEALPGTHAKVGASMGPLTVQVQNGEFNAEGEELTLALELCNRGGDHQLVMTSKVWHSLSDSLEGWKAEANFHHVPGFAQPIPSRHLQRRLDGEYRRHCWSCGQNVQITQTAEGYIRLQCPNGHLQPHLTLVENEEEKREAS